VKAIGVLLIVGICFGEQELSRGRSGS
jgi:hypothetical protein